jgi:peptide/nickel transport system substrate-binding protein
MRFKNTRWHFLLLIVAILYPLASYTAEPKRGGSLRFGIQKNLQTLNPFVLMQSVDHAVRSLLYEGLLAFDRNLEPLPSLASSWNISPDGLLYTFTLRQGVRFHNGKPLTPGDIKWSIDYVQDQKNGAFGYTDALLIGKVDVEEPNHIRIRLKTPFAAFLTVASGIRLFPAIPKDSVEPRERKREALPSGTGPFHFVEWKPGQELRVHKFEGYWQKGLPYLDEIRFLVISDDTVRLNAARVGDLDIAEEIAADQTSRIREGKMPGVRLALADAVKHPRMGINHCRPPFNNIKVRQAFAYALNKQELIDGLYSGLGHPTNQKLLRGTKWFVSEVPDRKQDLARARALLAEAGYPDGVKVIASGWPMTEKELQIIQSQVKKAGFEVEILIRDFASHIAALNKADFQISFSGGATNSDPDLAYYAYYHTPPPERWGLGGRAQPCYSNKRVDQLLEDARKVTDFQSRRRMYREVIEILQEEVADIPIGFVPKGFAFQSHVRDFDPGIVTEAFSYGNGGLLRAWLDK